jgi:hypothetical protein
MICILATIQPAKQRDWRLCSECILLATSTRADKVSDLEKGDNWKDVLDEIASLDCQYLVSLCIDHYEVPR